MARGGRAQKARPHHGYMAPALFLARRGTTTSMRPVLVADNRAAAMILTISNGCPALCGASSRLSVYGSVVLYWLLCGRGRQQRRVETATHTDPLQMAHPPADTIEPQP